MDFNDENEWDILSIKRYEKLLMFEAEYPVRQMELLGEASSLCCLGDKKVCGVHTTMLTVYNLPPRLATKNSKASLSPDFDLKIVAGTFNKNHISQIACIPKSDYVIASEAGADELLMYRLNTNESDKLVMSGVLNCEGLTNPRISASSDFIVASKSSDSKISIIDIKSRSEIEKRNWLNCTAESLVPLILGPQTVLVYSTQDASAAVFDLRQKQTAGYINGGRGEESKWSAGSAYEEGINTESNTIAFLSNCGTAKFYRLQHLESPYSKIDLGSRLQQQPPGQTRSSVDNQMEAVVKLNPLNESTAAIGGLDSRIYVVDTKPNCSVTFTHDGHEHMESCLGSDTRTTWHTFYTPGGDKTLISSSDNSSINCWLYNAD